MFCRRLSKNGQITIPKKVEEQLKLKEGHYLYIYKQNESVIITPNHLNKTLNQCIYRNGKVSIPSEIRKFVGISSDTTLSITVDNLQSNIIIRDLKKVAL